MTNLLQGVQCRWCQTGEHCPTHWGKLIALFDPQKRPAGSVLYLLPDTTKNKKGGYCVVTLTCDILYLCTWLQLAVHHHAAAGQPITRFLARPLQLNTKQYGKKGMTCSNAWARLNQVLESTGHVHKSKCAQH